MSNHNLYQRNGVWWFCIVRNGKKLRESLRVGDVKSARRLRDQKLQRIAEETAGISSPAWRDAVAAWLVHIEGQIAPKTAQRYAVSLKQCEPYLINLKLSDIKKQTIADLAAKRRKTGATIATVRRDLTAISVVLTHAQSQGHDVLNPTIELRKGLKERRDPITLPTREAIEAAILAAPKRFAALIRAAELTGCRLDELVTAEWPSFSPDERTLRVKGKGNKVRTIDLSDAAMTHIKTHPKATDSALIFCHGGGEAYANASSNFSQICRRIEKADKTFKRFRFHDLRHFYAVNALLGGMDLWTLSRQLGHTSVKVTESFYLRFASQKQTDAARKASTQNRTHLQRFGDGEGGD